MHLPKPAPKTSQTDPPPQTRWHDGCIGSILKRQKCFAMRYIKLTTPSTSYRIGKPTKCKKKTSTYKKWDSPKYPFRYLLRIPPKYENRIFGSIFLVFSGFSSDLMAQGKFGCRTGILGLFWGLWGFLLCSWVVGCQGLSLRAFMNHDDFGGVDGFGGSEENIALLLLVSERKELGP